MHELSCAESTRNFHVIPLGEQQAIDFMCSLKGIRHSRCYICFKDAAAALDFREAFDGHTFVSERGQQYKCSVQFAPYQRAPKTLSKKDPREGSLEAGTELAIPPLKAGLVSAGVLYAQEWIPSPSPIE